MGRDARPDGVSLPSSLPAAGGGGDDDDDDALKSVHELCI